MKKTITLILTLTLLVWGLPAAGVYAADRSSPEEAKAEYAKDRVLVLYEDGAVDTEKPHSVSARKAQSSAESEHKAKSFGVSSASLGEEAVDEAENTLGQQAAILDKSLKSDYTIEDTVVFETEGKAPDMVISTVSSDSMDVPQLMDRLSRNDKVRIVEPDYVVHTTDVDWHNWDDPYKGDKHQLTGENSIHADALWESDEYKQHVEATESAEDAVVVAVLDTGVDYTHDDLKDRMWHKPNSRAFSQYLGKYGYDFSDYDYDPMDENGHGSHCAGIIAAEANNAVGMEGVAGVSDKVSLMAVRVLNANGSGNNSTIIAGIRYITAMRKAGANVRAINCPIGGNSDSQIYNEALDAAGEAGILSMVAAANNGQDNDLVSVLPATADSDYRVTVAASDENGQLASYSCYGRRSVDIVAPGSNILSTVPYDNYAPYLYDADTLGENTAFYGEFDGAAVETDGDEIISVQPVTGTDHNGNKIGNKVGSFGPSVMRSDKVKGSNGKASLEMREDSSFPIGNNKKHLRWKITDAQKGDTYILFFPYTKDPGDYSSTYTNVAFRSHMESGSGTASIGDVMINGVDDDGRADWEDTSSLNNGSGIRNISPLVNSIWRASGKSNVLFPFTKVQGAEGYGLGIVYTAKVAGNCWFDISSLAIAKKDTDEETFGKYDVYSGTSMATPVAAGTAAILSALDPEMSVLELKNALFSATRPEYPDWCSTGGIIDLREYKAPAGGRPAVSKVTADFEAGTVRLQGSGFGTAPTVTVTNTVSGVTEGIPVNDLRMEDGTIVISNAGARTGPDDQVNHGIIGSDVVFAVRNTQNNKTGTMADYVVGGFTAYEDACSFDPYTDFTKKRKDTELPEGMGFITTGNALLLHDGGQRIYRMEKDAKTGSYRAKQLGTSVRDAINEYVAQIYADDSRKDSLWHPLNKTTESDFGFYWITKMSDPVYMGGKVYDLVRADLGYAKATLLLALDLNSQKWAVCYDSLEEYGTAPDNLRWKNIDTTTLAGYKGKLYIFGSMRTDETYVGDEPKPQAPEYTEADIQTEVFSCEPRENGVDWVQESASLPRARARGVAVNQGGDLYYVLSSRNSKAVDYSVYKFDGQDWTVAGTLPKALHLGQKGGQRVSDGYYIVRYGTYTSVPCAVGPDSQGILFGGTSFSGAGDTFRFNTATGKVEPLGYTLWGHASYAATSGTVAGDKLWVQYQDDNSGEIIARTIGATPDPNAELVPDAAGPSGDPSGDSSGDQGKSKASTDTGKNQIHPEGTTIRKLKKGKKAVKVKWKKVTSKQASANITGYQIQLATDSQFKENVKTVNVKGYKKVSKKIKKLKGGKKYYVHIRTYQTYSGRKYYSSWSRVRTVKTKS